MKIDGIIIFSCLLTSRDLPHVPGTHHLLTAAGARVHDTGPGGETRVVIMATSDNIHTGDCCHILDPPDSAVPGLAGPEHGGPLHGAGAGVQGGHSGGLDAAASLPQAQASVQSGAALETQLL